MSKWSRRFKADWQNARRALRHVIEYADEEDALAGAATGAGIGAVGVIGAADAVYHLGEYGYTKWKAWKSRKRKKPGGDPEDSGDDGQGRHPSPGSDPDPDPFSPLDGPEQGNGVRRKFTRRVRKRLHPYNEGKLFRSALVNIEQGLGMMQTTAGTVVQDLMVSEYNPGTAGAVGIYQDGSVINTAAGASEEGILPFHVYDLNYLIANQPDSPILAGTSPVASTTQCHDLNSRLWVWTSQNRFVGTRSALFQGSAYTIDPRWMLRGDKEPAQRETMGTKVYRTGIDVRLMLYGCNKMDTEYDIKIVRITDPKMCPDYPTSLVDDANRISNDLSLFRLRYQRLVRPYVTNPMMRGLLPSNNHTDSKKWFHVVAQKRVRVGEQTTEIEQAPCVVANLNVRLNELTNYAWNEKDYGIATGTTVESMVEADVGANTVFNHKPYYTSRYYLFIRALAPKDLAPARGAGPANTNNDGDATIVAGKEIYNFNRPLTDVDYLPSYDIALRTFYKGVRTSGLP